ncbi:MAG: hypothetical protein WHS38_02635 [Thermodesulforhabdaceae bacterium]
MRWKDTLERIFAAVAFAEQGREKEAMEMAGVRESRRTLKQIIEDYSTATAFAEAQEFGYAYALATDTVAKPAQKPTLLSFLETVGLKGAPVYYGTVKI